ncbi:MAG TPA: hypothetical protein PKD55_16505, partial [Bellilinea sp.]|nr:hypothetical protein [Bellilinea sp.]
MRDQRYGIDRLPIRLRVQRGVAVKVGFQARRARKGQFDALGLGQRPKPQLLGRVHRMAPRWKNIGWYGRNTRSR